MLHGLGTRLTHQHFLTASVCVCVCMTQNGVSVDTYCDMTTDGGGWTYVNEPGRAFDRGDDLFVETPGGYHRFIYDLRGMVADEVLVRRT